MVRLIMVSFAFLAFVFYEMSGGADFDPDATRLARIEIPPKVEQDTLDRAADAETELQLPDNVTRVALNLTQVDSVVPTPAPEPQEVDVPQATNVTQAEKIQEAVETAYEGVSEEEPTLILPSLITDRTVIEPQPQQIEETIAASLPTPAQSFDGADLREVTGNSVNVRGGPGTEYDVVNRLGRGDLVEVLQESGDGWVRMRPVEGGTEGWMAAFLLTEG